MPRSGTQRRRVFDHIQRAGLATREGIAICLDMSENSVRPRVAELMEGGWLEVAGTKKNDQGQTVEVLRVKE